MNQFRKLFSGAWSILVVCTLAFAMAGCEGDDGAQGPEGPQGPIGNTGPAGADGEDASIVPLESCGVCHGDMSFADAAVAHALPPLEVVSGVDFAEAEGTLSISFAVAVDGVASDAYDTLQRIYVTDGDTRLSGLQDFAELSYADGLYTVDIDIVAAGIDTEVPSRYVVRVAINDDRETRAYVVGDYPEVLFVPLASDQACQGCHGGEGEGIHFASQMSTSQCLVCHGVEGRPPLAQIVHGYHSGVATWEDPVEAIEITYPTYMTNCSVCHSPDEAVGEGSQLDAANSMGVSGANCLSCHGSMDNPYFDFAGGLSFHLDIVDPIAANCGGTCHAPAPDGAARYLVTQFHNGIETERHGWILDGEDASLTEGALFDWRITGASYVNDGADIAITWVADYGDVGVDPCNATAAEGAPVFFAGDGDLTMYRNYAQGDDFMLGTGSSPGAPSSVDLTVDNTTCDKGIATTVLPAEAVAAEKGRLALGGKPLVLAPEGLAGLEDVPAVIEARVPTPTYDFLMADASVADSRRAVVDTDKCLGCHRGSLYQHGGDRVDNVDMCLMCHNVASNEQNVRVGMGVDASEAYDGRVGETYGMKTMLHRVHSANYEFEDGRFNDPYLVYRGRGIYAFAAEGDFPPNWDAGEACVDRFGRAATVVNGADDPVAGCQVHNFEAPTFPRLLNDCAACHDEDFASIIPDQTIAMATTVEAGAEPWNAYLDDVLQGPATTACTSCHADFASKGHAYQNSWVPQDFPEGRNTIINAVN